MHTCFHSKSYSKKRLDEDRPVRSGSFSWLARSAIQLRCMERFGPIRALHRGPVMPAWATGPLDMNHAFQQSTRHMARRMWLGLNEMT